MISLSESYVHSRRASCKGYDVTKIGLPETRLGIIPGAGGTQRAARLLGVSKAKELIFTGRSLTAQDAADLGETIVLCVVLRCEILTEKPGLVGCVSKEGQTALDRALELAKEMSSGGKSLR